MCSIKFELASNSVRIIRRLMNELSKEKSPYLLQHKDNPVWWRAWGEKAFAKARAENKLIFLSIGYATCHWCHVMEHESFEDQKIADLLNQNYISIKADREELPDVDQIYMDAIHAMGQRGGWPLNIFLTPDLKPFYGGTYFPKPQFAQILMRLQEVWQKEQNSILTSSEQLHTFLTEQTAQYRQPTRATTKIYDNFIKQALESFDSQWGGFGGAPKFPPCTQLFLLSRLVSLSRNPQFILDRELQSYLQGQEQQLLSVYEKTLHAMSAGGLYDHVGGGFTRYSVDERWEIPHFEKMLYVNALLVLNFLEAHQLTKNKLYLHVAEDTLEYLMRDMLSSGGGFYSAEDADSEGEEGRFYVWSYDELKSLLTPAELQWAKVNLNVTTGGNFEGLNHLWSKHHHYDVATYSTIREKLFEAREKRERPLLDDKQLTAWNALMIWALSYAYKVTQKKEYLQASVKAAEFIQSQLWRRGTLYRRYRQGQVDYQGTLDDYAYLIRSCIELYTATVDEKWLLWAQELQRTQDSEFADSTGYFYTGKNEKNLIVRTKDFADNALPNSNAIAIENLIYLSAYFENEDFRKQAVGAFECVSVAAEKYPTAFSTALAAGLWFYNETHELVAKTLPRDELARKFSPFLILGQSSSKSTMPLLKGKDSGFYLCRFGACEKPVKTWDEINAKLPT